MRRHGALEMVCDFMASSGPIKNIHGVSREELFRYEGYAFVEMLYRVVLRRPPDEAGFAYHLNNLLVLGQSKGANSRQFPGV